MRRSVRRIACVRSSRRRARLIVIGVGDDLPAATDRAGHQRQHRVGDDASRRRSLPAAAERTVERGLDQQSASHPRRRQRLPHRRHSAPVGSAAPAADELGRVGRHLQVARRRSELEEHAAARLSTGSRRRPRRCGATTPPPIRSCAPAPTACSISPGLAFDRGDNAPSAIFVARFKDMNNLEAGDPIVHLDTRIADSDPGGRFLDKPALATDIPRTAATCSFNVPLGDAAGTVVPQTIPAGNVYVAYAAFTGSGATEQSAIMFTRSTDCGATWSAPTRLSTGSRLVQNRADRRQPGQRARLRVLAALQVRHAGRRDDRRALDRRRRDVRQAGAGGRTAAVRPADHA